MMTTTAHTHERGILHRARLYDLGTLVFGARVRALHRRLLARASIRPGERVLDVGCGPGRLTMAAAADAGETVGIDASPEMIALATRRARRAGSRVRFEVAGIEALPAADGSFDVVLASLMLHHLPDELQRRGVAEVLRVLAPGGRFVALDFAAEPGHGVGHLLSVLGLRRGSAHAEHLRALARDAGFSDVTIDAADGAFCILIARKAAAS